jgi:glycosyltransferase involved in cell wall biosynthesis
MNSIEITVLMPVYNCEKYLKEAMDSILNQTLQSFEFLIIDDGSTDTSLDIIKSYHDDRIRLLSISNSGVAKALNYGLNVASGKYIARMDADDISYPDRLRLQYDFMEQNSDYVAIGADINYLTESGDFLFHFAQVAHSNEDIKKTCRIKCPLVHSVVFMRKDAVIECGGYPEVYNFEDHLLWIKLLEKGKLCNLNITLIDVRLNPHSVTMDERDIGQVFTTIKEKTLLTGSISEEDKKKLIACVKRFSPMEKEISYYRMVGKKYLWNTYQPKNARKYFLKAIKLKPFHGFTHFLFWLSFFPEKWILELYAAIKSK